MDCGRILCIVGESNRYYALRGIADSILPRYRNRASTSACGTTKSWLSKDVPGNLSDKDICSSDLHVCVFGPKYMHLNRETLSGL